MGDFLQVFNTEISLTILIPELQIYYSIDRNPSVEKYSTWNNQPHGFETVL